MFVLSATLVYCGQTVGWIQMKLGMQVDLDPSHIVLDGDPGPLLQRGTVPQFLAHICCGQMAGWIKMPPGMEVGLGPGDFVARWGPSSSSPKRGRSLPLFSAHVYCGQTAAWITMALGMEVGLHPGHTVLDRELAPLPKKGAESPIFSPFLLWPNGWMQQDG